MNVVLLGNYRPDKQQSMRRYAEALLEELLDLEVEAQIVVPPVVVGRLIQNKWSGYVDKFLIFPILLRVWNLLGRFGKDALFHICDHSNALWVSSLPPARTVITCHDVLAIRGARGFVDAHCPASVTGRMLQELILSGLARCSNIVCVSHLTDGQLSGLLATKRSERVQSGKQRRYVIHNSFNADFTPLLERDRLEALRVLNVHHDRPFLLHVGSGLERKNRAMLIRMVQDLESDPNHQVIDVVFAGQAIDRSLNLVIDQANLNAIVLEVERPDHEELVALYQSCAAFVFPSYSEGFGWPIIEAQACGAPVICSDIEPFPEVGGQAALYADPHESKQFAEAFRSLSDPMVLSELRQQRETNTRRFDRRPLTLMYNRVYEEMRHDVS